jgi:glycosyltransferase involved in cell wall biosynthesis
MTNDVIIVNNHAETFDDVASGAIATHIWECWRVSDEPRPTVCTRLGAATPYDARPLRVLPNSETNADLVERARRRVARALGWSSWSQRAYARHVRRNLEGHPGIDRGPATVFFHNDPELAVSFARRHPGIDVRHLFHNLTEMPPRTVGVLRTVGVRMFAVSEYVARWIEESGDMPEGPVIAVHNGVDCDAFRPSAAGIARDRSGYTIGFLGRPGVEKAPDLLLEAVSAMSDLRGVRVLLAGLNHLTHHVADAYQLRLDVIGSEIEARGGEFRRVGRLPRSRVPDFLREIDVFVLPSRWEEPCALVLLEAMATGIPVVATRTGGTPEILRDAGVIIERDAKADLTGALDRLRTDYRARDALGKSARLRAEQFTWASTWRALLSDGRADR